MCSLLCVFSWHDWVNDAPQTSHLLNFSVIYCDTSVGQIKRMMHRQHHICNISLLCVLSACLWWHVFRKYQSVGLSPVKIISCEYSVFLLTLIKKTSDIFGLSPVKILFCEYFVCLWWLSYLKKKKKHKIFLVWLL